MGMNGAHILFSSSYSHPCISSFNLSLDSCLSCLSLSSLVRSVGTAAPATSVAMKGSQLTEFDQETLGLSGFSENAAEGPFGTIKSPVRIYSSFHTRIVACKGSDNHQHRISWFELKQGPKHVCTECGQVFQLATPDTIGEASVAAKQLAKPQQH